MNETLYRTDRLVVRPLGPGDEAVLQSTFEAAGDYFRTITGRPAPDADAAEREIQASAQADGRSIALLSTAAGGATVGALGWWERHPEPDVALLGMLMIVPEQRGRGLAREAVDGLLEHLAGVEIERVRTAVGAGDQGAHAFLRALGFEPLEERAHVGLDRGRIMISFFERATKP